MVNIYLFLELLSSANAVATVDTLKALSLDNCKFANVVALSDEKLVAQLDCNDSPAGDKAIFHNIARSREWFKQILSRWCVQKNSGGSIERNAYA